MNILETFNESIIYIEEHLTDDLSVKDVAEHVYVSTFHFQRMFLIYTGINVGEYIRSRRLSMAAEDLLAKDVKVIDTAIKYGYETSESFARAFKRFHGVLPNQVRRCSGHIKLYPRLEIVVSVKGGKPMEYKITNRDSFKITILIHKFHNETSKNEIPKFWDEFMKKGYHNDVCPMLGVCLPMKEGDKEFAYGIGAFNNFVKRVPQGFVERTIPALTWAEFPCVGPMPHTIQDTWKKIYTEWLPNSRYEIIPSYDFEYYEEGDIHSPTYKCWIWIPVRLKP